MNRRREYYDALLAVSKRGDWLGWARLFLQAVQDGATEDRQRVAALVSLRERYVKALAMTRDRGHGERVVTEITGKRYGWVYRAGEVLRALDAPWEFV